MAGVPLPPGGWIALGIIHVASVLFLTFAIASAPDPSGQVALVYSPFTPPAQAFQSAAARARVVRVGREPWIVVVAPDPGDKDFSAAAHAGGALLLLNPGVAGACAPKPAAASMRS